MSNFFGALGSDDDEPVKVSTNKKADAGSKGKAEAAAALPASKESADRLTGAAKKNRDNKRHGASSKLKKEDGEKPVESKKREFDRRSGTGKNPGQSKNGRGKFAFGSPDQEAEQATKDPSTAEVPVDVEPAAEESVAEVAEPVVPQKSMEDFLAERAAKKAAVAALAGAKKERTVATVAVSGKTVEPELLSGNAGVKEAPKGPSKRMQETKTIEISYGFRSTEYEERPPREDRPPRAPREGDAPREDRPPRAPREDRPPRQPRKEGDSAAATKGAEGKGTRRADGARTQNKGPRDGARSKGPQVNLKDTEAFPAL